jgi:hypothetical protein
MAKLSSTRVYGNLTIDGSLIGPIVSGESKNLRVFTSGSNQTYTPTTGLTCALVIVTGGGGGGGGADNSDSSSCSGGGGGASGGTAIRLYTAAEMGATALYTVGAAGGSGSSSGGSGTAGGNTTFDPAGTGATLTANGGAGGTGSGQPGTGNQAAGGTGGTATGGTINIDGGDGGYGSGDDISQIALGGEAGVSFWGGGSGRATAWGATTYPGYTANTNTFGAGGGGAASADTTSGSIGGEPVQGVVFILEFF